jgi:hypothetical protein
MNYHITHFHIKKEEHMTQITLDTDIKFILKHLSIEQKGQLLNLLLEEDTSHISEDVTNIFTYLKHQIEKKQIQKNKMKTLAQKACLSRWKNKTITQERKCVYEFVARYPPRQNAAGRFPRCH